MRAYDIIYKKKCGGELTKDELDFLIGGCLAGKIPDYQITAWLMAVCFVGMTDRETADLTEIMAYSGDTIDLSMFGDLSVDKHSTGGVGDKTTLVVAPICASLGCKVAKMSGRGLGHTGGTVDKLESISGFKTYLEKDSFLKQVENIGIAVIGQTPNLTPADKKLYALRDVTATVDSIPLITSSIMSKKLAAGAKNITLDVKVGSGAFMKTLDEAEKLARNMIAIGKACGRKMSALITNMDAPLGYAVGNSLEVREAVGILRDGVQDELYELCVELSADILSSVRKADIEESRSLVRKAISDGSAYRKMLEWVEAQGGDVNIVETDGYKSAGICCEVKSERDGYIARTDAHKLGTAAMTLGVGRLAKSDPIDHTAGILLNHKVGDFVRQGELLFTLYTNKRETLDKARNIALQAVEISDNKPDNQPLIYRSL